MSAHHQKRQQSLGVVNTSVITNAPNHQLKSNNFIETRGATAAYIRNSYASVSFTLSLWIITIHLSTVILMLNNGCIYREAE